MIREYWIRIRVVRVMDRVWIDFVPMQFRNHAHIKYMILNGFSFYNNETNTSRITKNLYIILFRPRRRLIETSINFCTYLLYAKLASFFLGVLLLLKISCSLYFTCLRSFYPQLLFSFYYFGLFRPIFEAKLQHFIYITVRAIIRR